MNSFTISISNIHCLHSIISWRRHFTSWAVCCTEVKKTTAFEQKWWTTSFCSLTLTVQWTEDLISKITAWNHRMWWRWNKSRGNMASGSSNIMGSKPQLDNQQLQMTTVPPTFHPKCGQLVTLCSNRRTATRSHAVQEFNHGLVFSHTALVDNQVCFWYLIPFVREILFNRPISFPDFRS